MIFTNNIDPEILNYGFIHIRWYGVFFLIGLALNYATMYWIFKREKFPVYDLDSLGIYLFIGLILGARMGFVLFYQPGYFIAHPVEILKIWNGGLASHGAAIGVFLAYLLWIFIHKVKFTKYADYFVLGFPVTAMFVRIGNFFNSEIVGYATSGNYGVIFSKLGENFPRHPAQLYEAILNLIIYIAAIFIYKKYGRRVPKLFFLMFYMLTYFVGRFFIEFYKDMHVLPQDFPLSMGQVLSILPIGIAAGWFLWKGLKKKFFYK